MSDHVTRRAFGPAAGAAGAGWLAADPETIHAALLHARRAVATPPPYQWSALTPAQAADLEAVTMRIFPTDETPGAREAGVIHFIDRTLAGRDAGEKALVVKGLDDLNRRARSRWPGTASFAALTPERQDELLKAVEATEFFRFTRFATIVGMFGNPSYGGNQGQVGWKLLGFEAHGIYQPPFGYYDAEAQRGG